MNIGICGVGVVGGALAHWLESETNHKIFKYDPPLNLTDDLTFCDVIFICVPVPTKEDGSQDLYILKESIDRFCITNRVPVIIRSSVIPGTCHALSRECILPIFAMPEFLTERTANKDVFKQKIICGVPTPNQYDDFIRHIFRNKKEILFCTNKEAEMAKYMHNGLGAIKVHFCNLIFELCKIHSLDYETVKQGALLSGYINQFHTSVPGPDGKMGFGGKCFPKDLKALVHLLKERGLFYKALEQILLENEQLRGSFD